MEWTLWGATLSPFALKVEAMLRFARVPCRWLPAEARFGEALRFERRRRALVRGHIELPAGRRMTDTTPMIAWLETQHPEPAVVPADPACDGRTAVCAELP